MLFIVVGVFVGLEKIIYECVGKWGFGFGVEVCFKVEIDIIDYFVDVMLEDLIKFGLILEFIGCLLVVVLVINLDKELLVKILFELKNVLVK